MDPNPFKVVLGITPKIESMGTSNKRRHSIGE